MSVLKNKRTQSKFEVLDFYMSLRQRITNELLYNFYYDIDKTKARKLKKLGCESEDELDEQQKGKYDYFLQKQISIDDWFLEQERTNLTNLMAEIHKLLTIANSIYAVTEEEYNLRRKHQNLAIGHLYALSNELQYTINTIPVNINKYTSLADDITHEIDLVKGWRKADHKRWKEKQEKENNKDSNKSEKETKNTKKGSGK